MPVTSQELFSKAVSRGMAASPFATTTAAPLYLLKGSTRTALKGCTIEVTDNAAKVEEYGIQHAYEIQAHIPKTILATKPSVTLDAVEYQSRKYNLTAVSGDEAHSPVWVISGSSPIKP